MKPRVNIKGENNKTMIHEIETRERIDLPLKLTLE